MRKLIGIAAVLALAAPGRAAPDDGPSPWLGDGVTHPGGDQIFWVPTFTQAQEMSRATGRPIFVMGGV